MMSVKTPRIADPELLTATQTTPALGRRVLGAFGWACLLVGLTGLTACNMDDGDGGDKSSGDPRAATDPRLAEPRGLLGTAPVDNYVIVPSLEPAGGPGGLYVSGLNASRFYLPTNPTRQAGLAVHPTSQNAVMLLAMQTTGSMEVSVWLGALAPATPQARVGLLGLVPSKSGPMSMELSPDPSSRMTANNINWQRYQASVSGLVGIAQLAIFIQGDLLVTGPVARSLKSAGPSAPMRGLNPAEEEAMRLLAEDMRDRFRAPKDEPIQIPGLTNAGS